MMYSVEIVGLLSSPSVYVPVAEISNHEPLHAISNRKEARANAAFSLFCILPLDASFVPSWDEHCCGPKNGGYCECPWSGNRSSLFVA